MESKKKLQVLGIRGVPAAHGGFETFAERFVLHLRDQGWDVLVYCQEEGAGAPWEDSWKGIRRVHVPVAGDGPKSTVVFDWKSVALAARDRSRMALTLGYNTAVFCARLRLAGIPNVINMDGVEWQRQKWGLMARTWFWLNDWAGCWLGNHLVADHPEIKRHLETRVRGKKITMIPYGADCVASADASLLQPYGLEPGRYAILIARAEPENSILEVVKAWSRRARGVKLVVLGKYENSHAYQRTVQAAASGEVLFPGAIYEQEVVQALRFHARFYVHGHRVGGTNPSLVEALGAGNAVLAHDNRFNRWVAGPEARYFTDEADCATALDELLAGKELIQTMSAASRRRHEAEFTWPKVLHDYQALVKQFVQCHTE